MSRFTRLLGLSILSTAVVLPAAVHAAVVTISHERLAQCGHGNVVCDGVHAFSLSAIESGLVQLPISSNKAQDFVIVNDTGAPVTLLQLVFFGQLSSNTDLTCLITADAKQALHACMVMGNGSSGDGTSTLRGPIDPPAELAYVSDSNQSGIPQGGFFDITVSGFSHGGCDRGYITGTGVPPSSNGGGPHGPPST